MNEHCLIVSNEAVTNERSLQIPSKRQVVDSYPSNTTSSRYRQRTHVFTVHRMSGTPQSRTAIVYTWGLTLALSPAGAQKTDRHAVGYNNSFCHHLSASTFPPGRAVQLRESSTGVHPECKHPLVVICFGCVDSVGGTVWCAKGGGGL